jgi:hypothetical protein
LPEQSPVRANGIRALPFRRLHGRVLLTPRSASVHPCGDGSSVENRSAAPLASHTGCNLNGHRPFLPNCHPRRDEWRIENEMPRPIILNFQFSILNSPDCFTAFARTERGVCFRIAVTVWQTVSGVAALKGNALCSVIRQFPSPERAQAVMALRLSA